MGSSIAIIKTYHKKSSISGKIGISNKINISSKVNIKTNFNKNIFKLSIIYNKRVSK